MCTGSTEPRLIYRTRAYAFLSIQRARSTATERETRCRLCLAWLCRVWRPARVSIVPITPSSPPFGSSPVCGARGSAWRLARVHVCRMQAPCHPSSATGHGSSVQGPREGAQRCVEPRTHFAMWPAACVWAAWRAPPSSLLALLLLLHGDRWPSRSLCLDHDHRIRLVIRAQAHRRKRKLSRSTSGV